MTKEYTQKEYIETFHRNKSRLAKAYEKLSFDAANGNVRSYFKELYKNTCAKLRESGYAVDRHQDLSTGMWFSIVYCSELVDFEPREETTEEYFQRIKIEQVEEEVRLAKQMVREKYTDDEITKLAESKQL